MLRNEYISLALILYLLLVAKGFCFVLLLLYFRGSCFIVEKMLTCESGILKSHSDTLIMLYIQKK